jgi:nucleotide-binding universal stress UspA family protein
VFLNILVGIDGSPSSLAALDRAVEIARAGNSKLTLMTVAPPVSSYVTLAGISSTQMSRELDVWAGEVVGNARARVPDGVLVHSVQGSGPAGPALVEELRRGGYDLIVLGSRGRGRAQEGLLGSVNAYVHFHAHVPLLTVPEERPPGS